MPNKRSDEGYTLPEVMITLLLLGIVSALLLGFLSNVLSTTSRATRDVDAEKEASLVLRSVAQDIRAASDISTTYPATSATSTCPQGGSYAAPSYSGYTQCVGFTIRQPTDGIATCPRTEVRYGVNNGELRQDRTVFKVVLGVCQAVDTTTGRSLMTNVTNTDIFSYLDGSGRNVLSPSPIGNPVDARTLKLHLVKRYQQNVPVLDFTTVLSLRNNR
jgi:prepilin-type N-terminal cleavage/methylation domain-containing protein